MSKELSNGDSPGEMLSAIEEDLQASLASINEWIEPAIEEMIAYHLGWSDPHESSGKRIRPLLVLLCCQACGGDWEKALPAASAIEWIHNFSLIHDDIQDRSEMRRGRPTVWKVWGTAQAINTGDAIFALSRLSNQRMLELEIPADTVVKVNSILDQASFALTRGQHLDISFEATDQIQVEAYLHMIRGKTAALLAAACHIGALVSPAPQEQVDIYESFGENLGLAFQIIDDLLGVWGESESTGKSVADDLRSRKKSLPIIHGLQNSQEFEHAWSVESFTDDHLETMKQILESSGSRKFTIEWAERFTGEAMAALQAAGPLEPAGSSLTSLAARLLQRTA
jgi:geranylgeranyl diphosphate synthase type I